MKRDTEQASLGASNEDPYKTILIFLDPYRSIWMHMGLESFTNADPYRFRFLMIHMDPYIAWSALENVNSIYLI